MKRLLKKPPPKLRPLLLKKAPTPLLLALTPLPLVPTLLLLVPKLLLRPTPLLLLRPLLTRRLLRLPTPRLLLRPLRLKPRSKSQPFGAMTETKKSGLPSGRPLFLCLTRALAAPVASQGQGPANSDLAIPAFAGMTEFKWS